MAHNKGHRPTTVLSGFAVAWLVCGLLPGGAAGTESGKSGGRVGVFSWGGTGVRIVVRPLSFDGARPVSPAVAEPSAPLLEVGDPDGPAQRVVLGGSSVEVRQKPLTVEITDREGRQIQRLVFEEDGTVSFRLEDVPVLGLGGGGPKPERGTDWRKLPIEYDRRGRYHAMLPRWQSDAYGSRNPAAVLVQPGEWGLFVASPWVAVDLREPHRGILVPWTPTTEDALPQTTRNQQQQRGKGRPPVETQLPGVFDIFVFDAKNPAQFLKDFATVTGPAALPPKWALGYMQSHRTLETDRQMLEIVSEFRTRKIPLDAVIYLGTGFTPRGWNTRQPSFAFNPEVFERDPVEILSAMHKENVKVVLHMVPWDRDKLPGLRGNIPPLPGETVDESHIQSYWDQHLPLIRAGVDAFWPDEGDWFDLHERIKRHQMYYQGHLSAQPDRRPWSLQRNGHPGIARWGGWVWSGDTECSWKSLEAQIAVGLNYGVSVGPFWGSDIGGFYSNRELTGELYARWFQFGAFTPSFRSHGRTWKTRLPWGWGLKDMAPVEGDPPLASEMNNPAIEPIVKRYAELRYQLLAYTYTLAWEARDQGLPLMRPMWVQFPEDAACQRLGNQYLWGPHLLIAPVHEKAATRRTVYLPKGVWYDWWSGKRESGGGEISREVDLATMPIYVRAGAILPVDPIRQYTAEPVNEPTTLKIYPGADGRFTLYEDDGVSQDYLKVGGTGVEFAWDDRGRRLTIRNPAGGSLRPLNTPRPFRIELISGEQARTVVFQGEALEVPLGRS